MPGHPLGDAFGDRTHLARRGIGYHNLGGADTRALERRRLRAGVYKQSKFSQRIETTQLIKAFQYEFSDVKSECKL
jgi:hypothetical protein